MANSKKFIQPERCPPEMLIKVIRESFIGSEQVYTQGSCIMFYRILKKIYPEALPYWSEKNKHMITKIGRKYFDISGEVHPTPDYELDDREEYNQVSIAVAFPLENKQWFNFISYTKMTDL